MRVCPNKNCVFAKFSGGIFFDNDQYCSACGSQLVKKKEKKCCCCGHHVDDNDKFCSGCGLPRKKALESNPSADKRKKSVR